MGDGGATSASWTTTIDNVLTGNGLNKTGAGTLVLNGANTTLQGTRLSAGTLSVSTDANLGTAANGLDFQGGTLRVTGTAFQSTPRMITWARLAAGSTSPTRAIPHTVAQARPGAGWLARASWC